MERTQAGLIWFALCAAAFAQGTEPKPKASDYPAHATAGNMEIGAEYMIHTFSGNGWTFIVNDYLVVEVALYFSGRQLISQGQFSLRVNRKTLLPQAPSFVAASLKYPDWTEKPRVVASAGPVIIGQPVPVERFPGDPTARRRVPPRVEGSEPKEPEVKAEDVVVQTALPEGELKGPVSGYLHFAFKGKPKSIRSLELIYAGPAGDARVKLL